MGKSLIALFLSLIPHSPGFAQEVLPRLKIDQKNITVSGVSSGAFMAVQMQVAFSKLIAGMGSVAGGTYWCSEGDPLKALACMSQPDSIRVENKVTETKRLAAAGEIDDPEHLRDKKIYIYASQEDQVARVGNSAKLIEFFSNFMNPKKIKYDESPTGAHGFPTLNYGLDCNNGQVPWLLNCQRDTAGDILKSMYGRLKKRGVYVAENLHKFSQEPFRQDGAPLSSEGWIYVPTACKKGRNCKLHVALHGCQMNSEFIQDQFAVYAGYNEWAESNGIVVLYPQTASDKKVNPVGCWDWFGITGHNYATKQGPQMSALRSMIRQVSGI